MRGSEPSLPPGFSRPWKIDRETCPGSLAYIQYACDRIFCNPQRLERSERSLEQSCVLADISLKRQGHRAWERPITRGNALQPQLVVGRNRFERRAHGRVHKRVRSAQPRGMGPPRASNRRPGAEHHDLRAHIGDHRESALRADPLVYPERRVSCSPGNRSAHRRRPRKLEPPAFRQYLLYRP